MINFTKAITGKTTKTFKNPTSTQGRTTIFKYLSLLAMVLMLGVNGVKGQTPVTLGGLTTGTCPFTSTATWTTPPTGLTFSNITRGSGVTCGSVGSAITGTGFNGNLATNITASKWFTFSITSNSTVTFTLSQLNIISRVSTTTGSPNISVQYSIGGSSPTTVIGSFTPTGSAATYTFTPVSPISVGASQALNIYIIPNALNASGTTCRVENASTFTVTASASATNYYWNGNGGSSLSANFNTGQWATSASVAPSLAWPSSGSTNVANFSNLQGGTVTMPTTFNTTPSNVIIGSAGYTFSTASSTPSTLSSTINLDANALTLSPNATSAALTLSGIISGTSGSLISNTGTTTLSGINTFTGGLTLSSGQLNINNASALGTTAGTFTINGGTIDNTFGSSITTSNYPQTWGGDFSFTGSSALNLGTGAVALGASASRTVTANASTLTVGGIISGSSSSLTKAGAGTLLLSGANTFNGGLNINAGTVSLGASDVLANSGAVNLNGGILNSAGAFTETIGTLTLTSGSITGATGTLTPSSMAVEAGTIDVILAGSGVMTKSTSGTVFLTNTNTYTGGTIINGGILSSNGASRLGSASGSLTINNGTFQFTTTSITSGRDIILGNAASTFEVVGSGVSYSATTGVISGTGNLNKTGTGILACSTACTYSGSTKIMLGTIRLNAANVFPSTELIIDGGTFSTGATTGFNETVGTLNLNSTGTIALGTGSHTLTFAASNGVTWAGTALNVTGWTGTAGATGTAGKIFVGTDATGLTAGQLAKITFSGYVGVTATILSTGEIVPDISVTPTVSTVGSLSAVNTTYGSASATPTSFSVSGASMTTGITITPPTGFEVSLASDFSSTIGTNGSPLTFGAAGTISSTIVYVRLSATATVGGSPYSGNIVLSSTGATPQNVATVSSTVSTATLTITGLSAADKTYDRTNTVSVTGTAAFSGLMNSESFIPTGSVTWDFADALVGASKSLSRTGTYAAPSTNYSVTQPSLTASITALTLTTSGSAGITSKTYDRTTTATVTGLSLTNVISGDIVTIAGAYNDKTVNTGKAVTISLSGADNANYTWTAPTGIIGDITAVTLTVTSPAVTSKAFDGTTAATITGSLSGVIVGDVVTFVGTGTFASSAIANGISVTSTSTLGGADAGNYTLTQPIGLTGNITASIIAGWNFFGQSSPTTFAATTFNANLVSTSSASNITRGAGAASSVGSNSFRTVGFQNNGIATSNTDYFQITLTAASGYATSLSSIDAKVVGTNTYVVTPGVSQQFAYSLDGTNFTLIGSSQSTIGTPATLTQIDLSGISALQNVASGTTITIRYYASGQTNTGGFGFTSATAATSDNGLSIGGLISAIPTNDWIGGTSNWNTGSNWSLTRVPLTTDNITISSGSPIMDVSHTLATGRTLTISGTGSLTINPSISLTIAGVADFGGKLVTVKSDATGTGSIGTISGTLSNASNVTVERYIASAGRRWRFLSSPVQSKTIVDWRNQFAITGPGANTPSTGIGDLNVNGWHQTYNNITNATPATTTSVRRYVEANSTSANLNLGWADVTKDTLLTAGRGFRTFIRGPISGVTTQLGVNGNATNQAEVTLSLSGTINSGDIAAPSLTYNQTGWNLLGNPYPCAFDWNAFHDAGRTISGGDTSGTNYTKIGAVAYIYDGTSNSYKSYSAVTNSGTLTSGIIPSGAGFFVQATSATPALTFKEIYKTTSVPIALHKTIINDEFTIKYSKDENENDEIIVKMIDGATLNRDGYDINKLGNENLNLSAYGTDDNLLTLSAIPFVTEETRIKLNVEATEVGTYKFEFTNMDQFDAGVSVSLYDRYTNTTTDVKKNTKYTFDMGAGVNQWGKNRFELILNGKATTGVNENTTNVESTTLSVYPNPATDVLNISLSNGTSIETVNIYNVSGKLVNNTKLNGNQIDISQLNNGVYMVEVLTSNGTFKTKFVK